MTPKWGCSFHTQELAASQISNKYTAGALWLGGTPGNFLAALSREFLKTRTNRPPWKRCMEYEQGCREGKKEGQTAPGPRGLGGLLKQGFLTKRNKVCLNIVKLGKRLQIAF